MTIERYQSAYTDFVNGEIELERHNYEQAIALFRKGIVTLGDAYQHPTITENSSMRIMLADMQEQQKHLYSAAGCLKDALDSRLFIYHRKLAEPAG